MAAYKALLENQNKEIHSPESENLFLFNSPLPPLDLPFSPPPSLNIPFIPRTTTAATVPVTPDTESFPKGVDFSKAERTKDGRLCVVKIDMVESVTKDPVLRCEHKMENKCHYTYVTFFKPSQEKICSEHFEKSCKIMFSQKSVEETVRKCFTPQVKVCDGTGEEECRTVYESSCTTKYVKKGLGKIVEF